MIGREALAEIIHAIYQEEARRQGDVRHADTYKDLPENIKEFDRVLADYILQRESGLHGIIAQLQNDLRWSEKLLDGRWGGSWDDSW